MASFLNLAETCTAHGLDWRPLATRVFEELPREAWDVDDRGALTVRDDALVTLAPELAAAAADGPDDSSYSMADMERRFSMDTKAIKGHIANAAQHLDGLLDGRINLRKGEVGRPSYVYTGDFVEAMENYFATMGLGTVTPEEVTTRDLSYDAQTLLKELLKAKGKTVAREAMADKMDCSPRRVSELMLELQAAGYDAKVAYEEVFLDREIRPNPLPVDVPAWGSSTVHRILAVTDLHAGSPECLIETLKWAYDEGERLGCEFAVNAGDIFDGPPAMHPGYEYRLKLPCLQDQIDWVAEHHPSNLQTYMITGNHDASWIKQAGFDPVRNLCERRDTHSYLHHAGVIDGFLPGPTGQPNFLCLHHGMDGSAYARSYKVQKYAEYLATQMEAVVGVSKHLDKTYAEQTMPPQLVLAGHYHKINLCPGPLGSWYFLLPALAALTDFQRGKMLINDTGAVIIEFMVGDDGRIRRIRPDFITVPGVREADYSTFRPKLMPVLSLPWQGDAAQSQGA